MKKFNFLIGLTGLFYIALMIITGCFILRQSAESDGLYLVEANRIMRGMEEQGGFSIPNFDEYEQIKSVDFLAGEDVFDTEKAAIFYHKKNGYETYKEPLIISGDVLGIVRMDYRQNVDNRKLFWFIESVLGVAGVLSTILILYVRNKVVRPFVLLRDMPYELSKGRLGTEVEESKDRYFGKFIWGMSMLRDTLKSSQAKNLKLEKEKKMMLLSVSHDIKTPLNSIKLYAKALEEGMYETKEEQKKVAKSIQKLSGEIEDFVREIVKNSSEEILPIEVENGEFYLKELVEKVKEYYDPKCKLIMTEFSVAGFENRLLKGNKDSAFEVIENLMENAFKYSDGKKITISFYEEDGCQIMKITSSGNPIKLDEMPHLFDSFYRGSNVGAQEGNGLGLYICREIMRKMEGEIFARCEEDGMSFHLAFVIC
ncbi:MAG: HAMP domain-containing histidine kinase [Lachnospiraceae bacterium]|nr:HAMP domain-containing histidine kinase [Lachnospiraceae bacterium]